VYVGSQEAKAVHAVSEHNTRAGVWFNDVHHPSEALGDRHATSPHRAPGQGLVPEPQDEEQETERKIEAHDAVWIIFAQSPDEGGARFSASPVHDFPQSPSYRRQGSDSTRLVCDVIAAGGPAGVPHDVMPAAAASSIPAATAAAAAATMSR